MQDTASSGGAVGTAAVEFHDVPLKVAAVPSRLVAKQNVEDVHETPVTSLSPVATGADQDPWLQTNELPSLLTVTQFPGRAQEIETNVPDGTSIVPLAVHVDGLLEAHV